MHTGENEQGLHKILDMTRMISIVLLLLHFYFYCYAAFKEWKLTATLSDRILTNIVRTGMFDQFNRSKLLALAFLAISLLGARGRKKEELARRIIAIYLATGLISYFASYFLLRMGVSSGTKAIAYMAVTSLGFILVLTGGTLLSRLIQSPANTDIFNKENESFPQEERLLTNGNSINLPASYEFKGKTRQSWINIVNPFRGTLVMGSPGSGKTYFVIQHIIKQQIKRDSACWCMILSMTTYPDSPIIILGRTKGLTLKAPPFTISISTIFPVPTDAIPSMLPPWLISQMPPNRPAPSS